MQARPCATRTPRTYLWSKLQWFHCTNYRGPWWTMQSKFRGGRNWREATLKILLARRSKQRAGSLCNMRGSPTVSRCRSTCWCPADTSALPPRTNYCTSTCLMSHPSQYRLRKSWKEAWGTTATHSTNHPFELVACASPRPRPVFADFAMVAQMVSLDCIRHGWHWSSGWLRSRIDDSTPIQLWCWPVLKEVPFLK